MSALLFWSFNSGYSLFSSYFVESGNPDIQSAGSFPSLSLALTDRDENIFGLYSAYEDALIVRDGMWFSPGIEGFYIEADTVFIPSFTEYSDTGIEDRIWPFGAVLGIRTEFLKDKPFSLAFSAYGGMEKVGYLYTEFLYGFSAEALFTAGQSLKFGLKAGYSDQEAFLGEISILLSKLSAMNLLAGFEIDGYYRTLKAGAEISLSENYDLLFGGNLTLSYWGWSVMSGFRMNNLMLRARPADLTLMLKFSPPLSITFSAGFEFGKKRALE